MTFYIKIMDSSIILPITFWNTSWPTFRISSLSITPNYEKLVVGSYSGQLSMMDLNLKKSEIIPRILFIGHRNSITCIVTTNNFAISSCEGGKICRWNLKDGYCEAEKKLLYIHRNMQLIKRDFYKEELLFTCGDYYDIIIYDSVTLQILCKLQSQISCNWLSNFYVINSFKKSNDEIWVRGISSDGYAVLWLLSEELNYSEIHSYNLNLSEVVDLKYNSDNSLILIITILYWYIFDSNLTNCLCKVRSCKNEKLLGGSFCHINIVIWTNYGKFYVYSFKNNQEELISIIVDDDARYSVFNPAMVVLQNLSTQNFFFKGDQNGKISSWTIDNISGKLNKLIVQTLNSKIASQMYLNIEQGFFSQFIGCSVSCCLFVLKLDKFFIGCHEGSILCIPAKLAIKSFYFDSVSKKPHFDILTAHKGKITCLSYPHEKFSHYSDSYLISGGSDFSVCLWDVFKLELIYKFCLQSGEIISLIIPPQECSTHVKHSICSISLDHSVAILSLKDLRCIILTSRHTYPVVTVNWKPWDDFLIVECFDGTVYVWQMETGHLDRIVDGIVGQEVIFACHQHDFFNDTLSNFYILEHISKQNLLKECLFETDYDLVNKPIGLKKFLLSETSIGYVILCNIGSLITYTLFSQGFDLGDTPVNIDKFYFLTQSVNSKFLKQTSALEKILTSSESLNGNLFKKEDYVENTKTEDTMTLRFFDCLSKSLEGFSQIILSCLHMWNIDPAVDELVLSSLGFLKPSKFIPSGIVSHLGSFSLFIFSGDGCSYWSSSQVATTSVAMAAFSKAFESFTVFPFSFLSSEERIKHRIEDSWTKLYCFYKKIFQYSNAEFNIPSPKVEILAKSWNIKCAPIKNVVQKMLANYVQELKSQENVNLLEYWYTYLPHFKILHKTSEKKDFENEYFKTVALVLFGIVGSNLKFRANLPSCQENYVYQTCAAFVYLLLLPNSEDAFNELQTIAIDFVGRGYIVWEEFLKMEKILPVLFQKCKNMSKFSSRFCSKKPIFFEKCITALEALKSIAIARTSAFINFLMTEISDIGTTQSRSDAFLLEDSKTEILFIITYLLEKTPYIMQLYLNEIILILIYCIDCSHLKEENLSNLIPIIKKFRQIHHSKISQKIAVGLGTGVIVIHNLKTGKNYTITAHKDSINALKFSKDGKFLASYCCYENRLSFWQIIIGLFGLGHMQIKYSKTCETPRIHDEEIRNHMEIAQITWIDAKSVCLSLCDGTENVFSALI